MFGQKPIMAAKVALVTRAAKEGMPGRVVPAEVAVRVVVQAGVQAKVEQVVKATNRELQMGGSKCPQKVIYYMQD
jgi:hypothetical protein